MLRRTCGILCSDSLIFEVLFYHINNFSLLFSVFLNFCLSVYKTYIKFLHYFYISHYFVMKFLHFITKFSHFFAKQIEAKFRKKSKNVSIFWKRTKCKNEAKWLQKNDYFFSLETLCVRTFTEKNFPPSSKNSYSITFLQYINMNNRNEWHWHAL